MQGNARKTKQIPLHCLGFLWWNRGFSKGYSQKNKKIRLLPNSRHGLLAWTVFSQKEPRTRYLASAGGVNSIKQKYIALISDFVNRSHAWVVGRFE